MEVLNSFFSNIKDKLSNPYFGTLIIVIIIHHWELIFGIFNFDNDSTLENKLEFVQNYIANNITWKSFLFDALQAMIYMFIGYIIVVFTRSIVLFIEYWLMPFITGKIVNKNVVRKTEYDQVVKEREQYFDQYEEQRNYVRKFSKTIDEQTEQIKNKDENLLDQTNKISETVRKLNLSKVELESLQNSNNDKIKEISQLKKSIESLENIRKINIDNIKGYESLYFNKNNNDFYSSISKFPPEVILKVQELKDDKKWDTFLSLGRFYYTGGTMSRELMTEMIKRGLAFETDELDGLTPVGKIIYHYNQVFNTASDDLFLLSRK